MYRRDRHLSLANSPVGGGVLCAIRTCFSSALMEIPGLGSLELVCVVLNLSTKRLFIMNVYIPPNSPSDIYDTFSGAVEFVSDQLLPSDDLIVVGDFNMPSLDWSFVDSDDFLSPSGG